MRIASRRGWFILTKGGLPILTTLLTAPTNLPVRSRPLPPILVEPPVGGWWWWASRSSLSLDQCVPLIRQLCPPEFLQAVADTGCLLYRGESDERLIRNQSSASSSTPTASPACILHPPPDLLDSSTYRNYPRALTFFQRLEDILVDSKARPSTGHIGTATKTEAEIWGDVVVSVWPLGRDWAYVWPKDRLVFYPNDDGDEQQQQQQKNHFNDINGRQQSSPRDNPVDNEYYVNERLDLALLSGKEVLFWTSWQSAFLAVPIRDSMNLLQRLAC